MLIVKISQVTYLPDIMTFVIKQSLQNQETDLFHLRVKLNNNAIISFSERSILDGENAALCFH